MNGATGFDGCEAFDADLMESAMLGRVGPALHAHMESCHECRVALAGYQLTVRSIRSVGTPPSPVLDRPRGPRRTWVPRLLIAAAAIAAAVLVLVRDAREVTTPAEPPQHATVVASYSDTPHLGDRFLVGNGRLEPVSTRGAARIDDLPDPVSDLLPRAKMECIELGGGCLCCIGCDLQMLVGDDQAEHRIPASLQGLEIGIHVGTKLFPHGGFILAPDSALL